LTSSSEIEAKSRIQYRISFEEVARLLNYYEGLPEGGQVIRIWVDNEREQVKVLIDGPELYLVPEGGETPERTIKVGGI